MTGQSVILYSQPYVILFMFFHFNQYRKHIQEALNLNIQTTNVRLLTYDKRRSAIIYDARFGRRREDDVK